MVDDVKAVRNATVAGKGEHHSRVAGQAKKTAVPDAEHDQDHENSASTLATGISQDLQHRLGCGEDHVEILDGEQEAAEDEKSSD